MTTAAKTLALAALLAAGAVTSAVAVPSKITATLEMYGGFTAYTGAKGNADFDSSTAGLIGGSGRVMMPFSDGWSGQLDLAGAGAFNSGDDSDEFADSVVGAVHVGKRFPSGNMLGLFGGGGSGIAESEESGKLWFIGAEGQFAFDNALLYGQAGLLDSVESDGDDSDTFHDAWFARLVGRLTLDPDTLLQGEFAYADGKQDTNDQDMNVISWGLRVERRLDTEPLSVFVAYEGARYDNIEGSCCSDTGRYVEHIGKIGLLVRFGTDGMTELDTPNVGRWVPSGDTID